MHTQNERLDHPIVKKVCWKIIYYALSEMNIFGGQSDLKIEERQGFLRYSYRIATRFAIARDWQELPDEDQRTATAFGEFVADLAFPESDASFIANARQIATIVVCLLRDLGFDLKRGKTKKSFQMFLHNSLSSDDRQLASSAVAMGLWDWFEFVYFPDTAAFKEVNEFAELNGWDTVFAVGLRSA